MLIISGDDFKDIFKEMAGLAAQIESNILNSQNLTYINTFKQTIIVVLKKCTHLRWLPYDYHNQEFAITEASTGRMLSHPRRRGRLGVVGAI